MMNQLCSSLTAAGVLLGAAALFSADAQAAVITDPANDFLTTYTGPRGADLDVVTAEVAYDGAFFTFSSTSNGNIGLTAGGFFVWGVNRGAGTARFGALAPGVTFDSVVILTPGGTSTVRDLIGGAATNLGASDVTITGATITGRVSAALLPTEGFTAGNYTVNLWPRLAGANDQISDFAPDNSNAQVTATPEPASAALVLGALAGLGVMLKRRTAR